MLETIYMVRHGCRSDWLEKHAEFRGDLNGRDLVILSSHGKDQAHELGEYLRDLNIDMCFTSPYFRCVQTATFALSEWDERKNGTKPPLFIYFPLAEFFYEDYHNKASPDTVEELLQKWPTINCINLMLNQRVGESHEEFASRTAKGLRLLIKFVESDFPDVRSICIFTHAMTLCIAGKILCRKPEFMQRTGTCSLSTFERVKDSKERLLFRCLGNGETDFLTNKEEKAYEIPKEDVQELLKKVDFETILDKANQHIAYIQFFEDFDKPYMLIKPKL